MIKKLIEKFFGKFCRCLETPIAPDVRICAKVFCDEHPKFKHRCPKCQETIKGK
jgi:hypothetical protein